MANFIMLTDEEGHNLLINREQILAVRIKGIKKPGDIGSIVYLRTGSENTMHFYVKETRQQILALIRESR